MNKQINKPFTKTCLFISYYLFKQLYLFIYTYTFMNLYLSFEFIFVFKCLKIYSNRRMAFMGFRRKIILTAPLHS